MKRAPIDRLLSRVDMNAMPGCWTWTGATSPKGYGLMRISQDFHQSVHRFSYEFHKGAIPLGLHIDHLCRNRACVNPDHLEAVTPQVNTLRGETLAAANAAKTHCKWGHEFTEANTYWMRAGGRDCRTCRAERSRRRWAAKRAAA